VFIDIFNKDSCEFSIFYYSWSLLLSFLAVLIMFDTPAAAPRAKNKKRKMEASQAII